MPYFFQIDFLLSKEFTSQEAVNASQLLSCRMSDSKQNSNMLVTPEATPGMQGKEGSDDQTTKEKDQMGLSQRLYWHQSLMSFE